MNNVVVGVSTSSGSPEALRCAAEEARWRGVELVAVQAWRPPRAPASPGGRPSAITLDTETAFGEAAEALRAHVSTILGTAANVHCKLVRGSPGKVLLEEAATAGLLVVDAPRSWAKSRSPLLAHKLVYNAKCPVMIMPPPPTGGEESALKRPSKRMATNVAMSAAAPGRPGVRF